MDPAALDSRSFEDLLREQREMVRRCASAVEGCLQFNEAIARKLAGTEGKFEAKHGEVPAVHILRHANTADVPTNRAVDVDTDEATAKAAGDIGGMTEPLLPKGVPAPAVAPTSSIGLNQRDRIIHALKQPAYNVEDFYWEEGYAQAVARNNLFNYITLGVIAANTIWMAIDTDWNKDADGHSPVVLTDSKPLFIVVANFFTLFFMFEIGVRFAAFQEKKYAFRDAWFVFDSTLVALMVWETYIVVIICWVMGGGVKTGGLKKLTIFRLFRLLRLTRVTRLARVLRAFPELMVLAKAMLMALRSLGATSALLMLVIYIFSIMFTQLLSETEIGQGYFETIPQTFNTLLMYGVFTEQREFIAHMLEGGFVYFLLIIGYFLVGSYTVLNMLIGVICEVITDVATREREDIMINDLRYKIGKISALFAEEEHQHIEDIQETMISRQAFSDLVDHPEATKALHDVGVDVVALVDLADFIFPESGEIELSKFMQTVLQFRGSNTATVKDIVDMRKYMSIQLQKIQSFEARLEAGEG